MTTAVTRAMTVVGASRDAVGLRVEGRGRAGAAVVPRGVADAREGERHERGRGRLLGGKRARPKDGAADHVVRSRRPPQDNVPGAGMVVSLRAKAQPVVTARAETSSSARAERATVASARGPGSVTRKLRPVMRRATGAGPRGPGRRCVEPLRDGLAVGLHPTEDGALALAHHGDDACPDQARDASGATLVILGSAFQLPAAASSTRPR